MPKKSGENKPASRPLRSNEFYVMKFGRLCAWLLIIFIALYVISGYGMVKTGMIYRATGGLFDRATSLRMHERLFLPMTFAFLCHTLIAIRFAMIRWQVKNKTLLSYCFLTLGAALFALAIYLYSA